MRFLFFSALSNCRPAADGTLFEGHGSKPEEGAFGTFDGEFLFVIFK